MSNHDLFTPAEQLKLEADAKKLTDTTGIRIRSFKTFLLIVLLGLVLIVEFEFLLTIFEYLMEGSSRTSIILMSMLGMLSITAFHLRVRESGGWMVSLLSRCVDVAIVVYTLGVAGILAAMIWANGASSLVASADQTGTELFAASVPVSEEKTAADYFDDVAGKFPMAFSIGCGCIAILNLFICHRLTELITHNVSEVSRRKANAREAKAAIEAVRHSQSEYFRLSKQRELLLHEDERAAEAALAHDIVAVIAQELAPFEKYLTEKLLRSPTAETRLRVPEEIALDPKEMSKRVATLKAIDVKTVLNVIRN